MVFIDKVKEIIKLFEESTREEIGISLLAYEEFICKNDKVTNKDLKRLQNVFEYYDENYSDDFPSLTNKVLQDSDLLICETLAFTKEDCKFQFEHSRNGNSTTLNVSVKDKTNGFPLDELHYKVMDNSLNDRHSENYFNTIYSACEKVKNHIKENNLNEILKSHKI